MVTLFPHWNKNTNTLVLHSEMYKNQCIVVNFSRNCIIGTQTTQNGDFVFKHPYSETALDEVLKQWKDEIDIWERYTT